LLQTRDITIYDWWTYTTQWLAAYSHWKKYKKIQEVYFISFFFFFFIFSMANLVTCELWRTIKNIRVTNQYIDFSCFQLHPWGSIVKTCKEMRYFQFFDISYWHFPTHSTIHNSRNTIERRKKTTCYIHRFSFLSKYILSPYRLIKI
jgi:hypothetical protein